MTEEEKSAYKEQVFGATTQSPTPPPTNGTPASTTVAVVEPTTVIPDAIIPTSTKVEDDEIVDADIYLNQQLGVNTWEEAKAALTELSQLREAAKTPAEIKYANEQSKQIHEAILAGEIDKVYDFIDTQKKLASVETMKPADAIKLHIQQTNRSYKPIDVEDVFEEKYSYPEKPVQRLEELDTDFSEREHKWESAKEKIDRRIERDAATAKAELSKLSAELKLPDIPKPKVTAPQVNEEEQKELQRINAETTAAYSKLSPKDIQMVFKFNDKASKLAFDIAYEPDKESFDNAVAIASDFDNKFWKTYFGEDGSPKRTEFLRDLYAGRNVQKIVSEAIVQAVNQERIRALKSQKNIGDGMQRNYVLPPVTETEKLRQAVFG